MALKKNLLPEKEYHAWDKNRVESLDRRSSADPAGGGWKSEKGLQSARVAWLRAAFRPAALPSEIRAGLSGGYEEKKYICNK